MASSGWVDGLLSFGGSTRSTLGVSFRLSCRGSDDFGQPDEVVGDHAEGEDSFGSGAAPDLELCHAADGLGPAKSFLDTFANAQTGEIAFMTGGTAVDQRFAHFAQLTDGAVDSDVWGDHGHIETRTSLVSTDIAWLQDQHAWPGLAAIGRVVRTREAGTRTSTETAYYVLSTALSAKRFGEVTRAHWGIENGLQSKRMSFVEGRLQDR